jgi:hypothetical protein
MNAGRETLLRARRELDAELSVRAPHDAAAAAKDQRELIGYVLMQTHRKPRAARGDVANNASKKLSVAAGIDMREILNIMTRTLPLFA